MPERDTTTGKYMNDVRAAQGKDTGDFKDFSDYGTQTSAKAAKNWGGAARMLKKGESNLTDDELFGD